MQKCDTALFIFVGAPPVVALAPPSSPKLLPPNEIPVLLGGHMRPGPPSEMNMNPEPRFCEAPCSQECAPACYDWCCSPSVQVPATGAQLVMMPLPAKAVPQQQAPSPLQYPMHEISLNSFSPCTPMPCSAKKAQVNKNEKAKTDSVSPTINSSLTNSTNLTNTNNSASQETVVTNSLKMNETTSSQSSVKKNYY